MKSIKDFNLQKLTSGKSYLPSPELWEEQVLYFLMTDRFSDGQEDLFVDNEGNLFDKGKTAPYEPEKDYENNTEDKRHKQGMKWNGGNLKGLQTKLGYLKRMGITTLWISPVLKQVVFEETYHGYGTQNFLEIDPHFGTREDLHSLVEEAHKMGLYVILDIIVNHSGDVFSYRKRKPRWRKIFPHRMKGFNDKHGKATISPRKAADHEKAWPDGSVWPRELQRPKAFTRRGRIMHWDKYPEYIEGDFYKLKNHDLGREHNHTFVPSEALRVITEAYKYWIAYADIDGFRLDTVKHMWPGAVKYFTEQIHAFSKSIGKENFCILGEITGGRTHSLKIKKYSGLNAALGINNIPESLENGVKGYQDIKNYFDLFENSRDEADNKERWFRDEVVTMFDDHDMVSQGEAYKARFCADKDTAQLVLNALFTNALTSGIPCFYYGTEQGFDGSGSHDSQIREAMFGGGFGAFRSSGRHFFREKDTLHPELQKILQIRREEQALKTGTQYYRMISPDGITFDYPVPPDEGRYEGIIAWSRFHEGHEIVLAINTHITQAIQRYIEIDSSLHQQGDQFECLYKSYEQQPGNLCSVTTQEDSTSLKVEVPAAGCTIFKRIKSPKN
jgi:glycosidase